MTNKRWVISYHLNGVMKSESFDNELLAILRQITLEGMGLLVTLHEKF